MSISAIVPSISPTIVPSATGRGPIAPVTGSDSRDIAESRKTALPRASDEASESRGERGEQQKTDNASRQAGEQGLDQAQLKELEKLKARDREVRAHEQAHQAVGGQYAGSVSYTYERGPDGNQYAIGGEVSIDVGPVEGDPEATIEKMRTVRAAAMAPAEPSAQDRAVAAQASQILIQAQAERAQEKESEQSETSPQDAAPAQNVSASDTYRQVSGYGDSGADRPVFDAVA